METALLKWLFNHFENTPKNEIQNNWNEIEKMNLEGPMIHEYINFINIYNAEDCDPPEQKISIPENICAPNYTEHIFLYRFAA